MSEDFRPGEVFRYVCKDLHRGKYLWHTMSFDRLIARHEGNMRAIDDPGLLFRVVKVAIREVEDD